jgi:hypothetical protein
VKAIDHISEGHRLSRGLGIAQSDGMADTRARLLRGAHPIHSLSEQSAAGASPVRIIRRNGQRVNEIVTPPGDPTRYFGDWGMKLL